MLMEKSVIVNVEHLTLIALMLRYQMIVQMGRSVKMDSACVWLPRLEKLTLQLLIGLAVPKLTMMAGVIAIVVLRIIQATVIIVLLLKMLVKRGIFAQHLPEHVNLKMVCVSIKFSQNSVR